MKMKHISKHTRTVSSIMLAGILSLSSCTDQFKNWNINPNEVTPDQM